MAGALGVPLLAVKGIINMNKKYMQIVSGRPVGEVIDQEKLATMFPQHDFAAGAPQGYAEYAPTPIPPLIRFQTVDISDVRLENGKVVDTINVRWMTPDEKAIDIELKRRAFIAQTGYTSWVYDEAIDRFAPPFPPPNPVDKGIYSWNEQNQSWDLIGTSEGQ